jgi:hypothetical protein
MAQRILRPLGYGELLDELFDLYKKHFVLFIGIFGIVQIPMNMLSTFAMMPWMRSMQAMSTGRPPADPSAVFGPMLHMFIWMAPLSLIGMVVGVVAVGATTWAVSSCYLGARPTILQSYKAIMPRVLQLLGTSILVYITTALGLVVCCVGVIPAGILTSLATESVILEGKSPVDALKRSYQLTAPNWVRVFVIGLLGIILILVLQSAISMPIQFIGTASQKSAPSLYLVSSLLSGLVGILTTPIWVIAYVLLYYDIRVRNEGFDIEMLAAGMGVQSPQPTPPGQA